MSAKWFISPILLLAVACSAQTVKKETLFAKIAFRESPYGEYSGIIPIDENTASNILHYKFEYDPQGRVTSISYYLGKVRMSAADIGDRFYFPASKMTFTYSENKIECEFFDRLDQPSTVYGTVRKAVYHLDEEGRKKSLEYYDANNALVETASGIARYTWERKDESTIIEKRTSLKGELMPLRPQFPFFETHITYGENGFVQKMQNFGKSGKLENNETGAAMDVITYDERGLFIGWDVLDKDGNLVAGNGPGVAKGRATFDDFGNEVKIEFFDADGSRMLNTEGLAIVETTFNEQHHISSQSMFGVDGKPISEGISIFMVSYDDFGNRKRISAHNAQKELIEAPQFFGAASQENEYDDLHNLIESRFYDAKGELASIAPLNGGSIIKYSYEGTQRTGVTVFDQDGNQIQL